MRKMAGLVLIGWAIVAGGCAVFEPTIAERVIGEWKYMGRPKGDLHSMEFRRDGTVRVHEVGADGAERDVLGTYSVVERLMTITLPDEGEHSCEVGIRNNAMVLYIDPAEGGPMVFHRMED